ncbi:hypothetical protein AVEN_75240-1 [Araneus ventricosus]|uniref:Uncharacterized protein n=1 Tax=Araneus ventricosus TaxID=182803 RepID=A0A4Y2P5Y9_ARAVE|nr:hypothetical protein AVEN_75240-1 [Araneus ventricosus]
MENISGYLSHRCCWEKKKAPEKTVLRNEQREHSFRSQQFPDSSRKSPLTAHNSRFSFIGSRPTELGYRVRNRPLKAAKPEMAFSSVFMLRRLSIDSTELKRTFSLFRLEALHWIIVQSMNTLVGSSRALNGYPN